MRQICRVSQKGTWSQCEGSSSQGGQGQLSSWFLSQIRSNVLWFIYLDTLLSLAKNSAIIVCSQKFSLVVKRNKFLYKFTFYSTHYHICAWPIFSRYPHFLLIRVTLANFFLLIYAYTHIFFAHSILLTCLVFILCLLTVMMLCVPLFLFPLEFFLFYTLHTSAAFQWILSGLVWGNKKKMCVL